MSVEELRPRRLNKDGTLSELMGTCIDDAVATFLERWEKDKDAHPKIVQMIHQGQLVDHWYYVSDNWISQPYQWPQEFIEAYVGPTGTLKACRYHQNVYTVENDQTQGLIALLQSVP